jgi:RecB family exonuclease
MMQLSYSKLSTFKACKYLFKRKYIDEQKPVETKTLSMTRGTLIHSDLEAYVKRGKKSPAAVKARVHIDPIIESGTARSEYDIIESFRGCRYRAIFDLYKEEDDQVVVADFKTGEPHDYSIQAEVYAGLAIVHSKKPRCEVTFIYVDKNQKYTSYYDAQILDKLVQYSADVDECIATESFIKEPCFKCRWCAECEFGGLWNGE